MANTKQTRMHKKLWENFKPKNQVKKFIPNLATTYVDNTTVNMRKEDNIPMQETLNDNMYKLTQYMSVNKLAMNNDKTKFMIMSKNKSNYRNVNIPAEPTNIKDSDNIKLLGVEISADLCFNYFLS